MEILASCSQNVPHLQGSLAMIFYEFQVTGILPLQLSERKPQTAREAEPCQSQTVMNKSEYIILYCILYDVPLL